MQRQRILDAVVHVVAERGAASTSVELVIARARISRRSFYEHFNNLEECLIAVLNGALERAAPLVSRAFDEEELWHDGMRCALAAMLEFFEAEPDLARVCIVETLAGGPHAREHREHIMQAFRTLVVARIQSEVTHASPLAPEGTMASVLGIVHTRLATHEPQPPLLQLLGPLMGIIVRPFMNDTQTAHEIEKGEQLTRALLSQRAPPTPAPGTDSTSIVSIPTALLDPRAHRARTCLRYIAAHPGLNNRQIAAGIGITHRGQISALLTLLSNHGLVSKQTGRRGHPNAWQVSTKGEAIARLYGEER